MQPTIENKVTRGICVARRLEISKTDRCWNEVTGEWDEVCRKIKLISTSLNRPFRKSTYDGRTLYAVSLIECSPSIVGFSVEDFENNFLIIFEV